MQKRSSYSLIQIGLWLRHLQNPHSLEMKSVRTGADIVLTELYSFNMSVSFAGAVKLADFLKSYQAVEDNEILGQERGDELKEIMRMLEEIIWAESHVRYYYVTEERRYNIKYLLESPGDLFAPNVFESLPDVCVHDFTEAFRCISYEVPTAAAFLLLRATEGCLKEVYYVYIKRNRQKRPMWGNMLEQLSNKTRNRPPASLLEGLDNIRRSYRNPTSHPESTYTLAEAEDLMGLCIDVTNKMFHAIESSV